MTEETKVDVIAKHLQLGKQPVRSFTAAVRTVMDMNGVNAKRLLKDLIDTTVEVSNDSAMVCKLAAAQLVQTEMKFRLSHDNMSLLPFNIHDFNEAMKFGRDNAGDYERVRLDEEGEPIKRGRKKGSGTYGLYENHFEDNPKDLDRDAKDVAQELADKFDVAYNTSLNYIYKIRRIKNQEEAA